MPFQAPQTHVRCQAQGPDPSGVDKISAIIRVSIWSFNIEHIAISEP
jgi:hypothetical protein